MNSRLIIVLLLSIFLIGCKKETRRFDIEDIRLEDYPVLTDTVTIKELIYNNSQISGLAEFLGWRYFSDEDSIDIKYKKWLRQNFDDFFWERINRDSIKADTFTLKTSIPFPLYFNSMVYRIIDTVELKENYGLLILKNTAEKDPYIYYEKLYLAVYNQRRENIGTYLVSEKYSGTDRSHRAKVNAYSELCNERWLTTHFKATYYRGFDSLYIRSTYDLRKHMLVKTDTINAKRKIRMVEDELIWIW